MMNDDVRKRKECFVFTIFCFFYLSVYLSPMDSRARYIFNIVHSIVLIYLLLEGRENDADENGVQIM